MSNAHFVSKYCDGEVCRICKDPATHKVLEVIFDDEPMPKINIGGKLVTGGRHEYVAYVCCNCYQLIFGGWTHK